MVEFLTCSSLATALNTLATRKQCTENTQNDLATPWQPSVTLLQVKPVFEFYIVQIKMDF